MIKKREYPQMFKKPTTDLARERYLRRRYGMTPEQVDFMEALQAGRCSECNKKTELSVDFDWTARTFKMSCKPCIAQRMNERPRGRYRKLELRVSVVNADPCI